MFGFLSAMEMGGEIGGGGRVHSTESPQGTRGSGYFWKDTQPMVS